MNERIHTISLGQGQGAIALNMISDAKKMDGGLCYKIVI